jgi:hypothetical protein
VGRSLLAIVAGYLFLTVLGRSASYVLAFAFPPVAAHGGGFVVPPALFAANLAAGLLGGIAGGNACARIARRHEMAHVAALAGILAAIGIGLLLQPPAGIPRSLALLEVATSLAGVLAGGALRAQAHAA